MISWYNMQDTSWYISHCLIITSIAEYKHLYTHIAYDVIIA